MWSQPTDQTRVEEALAAWSETHSGSFDWLSSSPEAQDRRNYGSKYVNYLWGRVRLITGAEGVTGAFVRALGGGGGNATTFSPNLIVFTETLDFTQRADLWWVMHELRHVMQAQALGGNHLTAYIALSVQGRAANPMEYDANAFASRAGTGAADRWD